MNSTILHLANMYKIDFKNVDQSSIPYTVKLVLALVQHEDYTACPRKSGTVFKVNFHKFALFNSYLFFIYWINQSFPIIMNPNH